MKCILSCLSILLSFSFSLNIFAQYTDIQFDIELWQNGMPNSNGNDTEHPTIRVFLPAKEKATGRAVVACPGGSYYGCACDLEGYNWAPFFNEQGIALIVLKYRMPKGNREVPVSDAEEAVRLVKENAQDWNINANDIGIMGSSAGGHLASTIATHTSDALRPAFQILFYPVISMEPELTHAHSRSNFLGDNPSRDLVDLYSNEKQVTSITPKAFIVFADDDSGVSSENGVRYYLALKRNKVSASLFIYPKGGHGFGATRDFDFREELNQNLTAWLNK